MPGLDVAQQRRAGGLGEEAHAGAAVGRGLLAHELGDVLGQRAQRARVGALAQHAGALRVVEGEQERLLEDARRALVDGVLGVALDLDRAAFTRGDEQAGGEAGERHAGRVVQRVARGDLRRRLRVRHHPLILRAGAARGDAGQGERRAHQLHELAAGEAGGGQVRADGELRAGLLQELRRGELLLQAEPVRLAVRALRRDRAGGGVLERFGHDVVVVLVRVGGGLVAARDDRERERRGGVLRGRAVRLGVHRWHVEQLVRE